MGPSRMSIQMYQTLFTRNNFVPSLTVHWRSSASTKKNGEYESLGYRAAVFRVFIFTIFAGFYDTHKKGSQK